METGGRSFLARLRIHFWDFRRHRHSAALPPIGNSARYRACLPVPHRRASNITWGQSHPGNAWEKRTTSSSRARETDPPTPPVPRADQTARPVDDGQPTSPFSFSRIAGRETPHGPQRRRPTTRTTGFAALRYHPDSCHNPFATVEFVSCEIGCFYYISSNCG